MAARRAPVVLATSRMERRWIMAGGLAGISKFRSQISKTGSGLRRGGRGRGNLGGLGRNLRGDIGLADRDGVGGDGVLDDAKDAPALQAAERAGLHDLDLVVDLGLVLLVMHMHDGLAIDDLVVERVRRLVGDGDLDRLVARAAGDEADDGLARVAGTGSDGGHGRNDFWNYDL